MKINDMITNNNISFEDLYEYLQNKDLGDWDSVNSEEVIREYIMDMMGQGVNVAHILEALEDNRSSEGLYEIWLGNSMQTPEPINTKKQLVEALGVEIK